MPLYLTSDYCMGGGSLPKAESRIGLFSREIGKNIKLYDGKECSEMQTSGHLMFITCMNSKWL